MTTLVDVIRAVHIAAGAVALVAMWGPLVSAKGGGTHRRWGRVFVLAMGIASVTALVACAVRLAFLQPTRGERVAVVFLAYVAVLTGVGALKGVRVLRQKSRTGPSRSLLDVGSSAVLLACAVAIALYGAVLRQPLLVSFSVLGIAGGVSGLAYWLRPPRHRMHWWFEHMGDMGGTCIAALTAFTVVNARHLGLGPFTLAVWLGPTLVGVPLLMLAGRHYRRRFGLAPDAASVPPAGSQPSGA